MKPEDIEDLKQLVDFLKEHQVAEFDFERGELKIRLKFSQAQAPASGISEVAQLLSSAQSNTAQPKTQGAPAAAVPAPEAGSDSELHLVKSPIVGTFYGSPSPGAAPFVAPGDRVEKGQVICIVEAMKLMNEIESDASGEIVKCFVSNGQPIEFGQTLFSVRLG